MQRLTVTYGEGLDYRELVIDAESFMWEVDGDQNATIRAFMGKEVTARFWLKEPLLIQQAAVTNGMGQGA